MMLCPPASSAMNNFQASSCKAFPHSSGSKALQYRNAAKILFLSSRSFLLQSIATTFYQHSTITNASGMNCELALNI